MLHLGPLWDGAERVLFFLFFIMQIYNLAISTCSYFFITPWAYVTTFESLNFLSSFLIESWLTNRMTKSGIIQICFAAALKGTLQLNRTHRQGSSSFYDFSLRSPEFLLLFHRVQSKALDPWQECHKPSDTAIQPRHTCSPGMCRPGGSPLLSIYKDAFSEHLKEVWVVV